jgi:hypothetical protein
MSLTVKLLRKYLSEEELQKISEEKMSPLRKYITSIGLDWAKLSSDQIYRISSSQAYKEFRKLNSIKYKYKKTSPVLNSLQYRSEAHIPGHEPKEFEPSKKYKHLNPTHVARQQYYAGLVNKGYSALRTAPLYKSVGPLGYKARKPDVITFRKSGVSPSGKTTTVASITKRELQKKKFYSGKAATYESFNENDDAKKKAIPKLKHMKEIKPQDEKQCEKEFEITKTLTGEKSPDTIQINPNMKIIRKSDKDKEIKKEQIKKPAAMQNNEAKPTKND